MVYHLHLTTSRRGCRLQHQEDLDQEVFQGFCLSKPLLIQRAACSAKKRKKKKVEGFDVPEILEEAMKKELLF